jgi:hypothetical protein
MEMENLNLVQKLHENLEEMKSVMKERDSIRREEEMLKLERDQLKENLQKTLATVSCVLPSYPASILFPFAYFNCTKDFSVLFPYMYIMYFDHIHPLYNFYVSPSPLFFNNF